MIENSPGKIMWNLLGKCEMRLFCGLKFTRYQHNNSTTITITKRRGASADKNKNGSSSEKKRRSTTTKTCRATSVIFNSSDEEGNLSLHYFRLRKNLGISNKGPAIYYKQHYFYNFFGFFLKIFCHEEEMAKCEEDLFIHFRWFHWITARSILNC